MFGCHFGCDVVGLLSARDAIAHARSTWTVRVARQHVRNLANLRGVDAPPKQITALPGDTNCEMYVAVCAGCVPGRVYMYIAI